MLNTDIYYLLFFIILVLKIKGKIKILPKPNFYCVTTQNDHNISAGKC